MIKQQYPVAVRQPYDFRDIQLEHNHQEVLMDLYQASLQPYQYIQYGGTVGGGNVTFTLPTKLNFLTVYADNKFMHPGTDYTVSANGLTLTMTVAPTTALSILGM